MSPFLPIDAFPSQDGHILDIPQLNDGRLATLQQPHQEEYPETTNFQVTPLTPKIEGGHHYYRDRVTCQISLNRGMPYKGVILAPALPDKSQLVLRCRAECWPCLNATSTPSTRRCQPAAFDLEPALDLKGDHPFELQFRQEQSNGPLITDVTHLIRCRAIGPKYGDQEWCCRSQSLM